ncbi:EpsG family protein [Bacteroides sp.]|uniref:EpsG family protein n=1 Tax=Bacteroides sp. TaxID=29523 RepID=UPI002FCC2261
MNVEIYRFSFVDLFPYIFLLSLSFWASSYKIKGVNSDSFICWLLIIFSAIRFGIGYDYFAYRMLILGESADHSWERIEPLARSIMELARSIHYQCFFIITSFLVIYPIYFVSKKYSKNASMSLILYILFPIFFLESMSIVRNAVAYSIVFLAFHFFLEKKYIQALILFCCSIGFHTSSLIGLFLLLIYYFRKGVFFNIILYLLSIGVSSFFLSAILDANSDFPALKIVINYALAGQVGAGNTMMILINIIGITNILLWKKLEKIDERNRLWLNIINFGVVLWNVFGFEGTLRLRLSSFFLLFLILLLPSYCYLCGYKYQKISRQLLYFLFVLVFCSSFYINISSHLKEGGKMSFLPYQTIFYNREYPLYVNP